MTLTDQFLNERETVELRASEDQYLHAIQPRGGLQALATGPNHVDFHRRALLLTIRCIQAGWRKACASSIHLTNADAAPLR
jgi:hypothetical protein